jgi:uncharacterized repeat protein (TIGR01451 family)
MKYNIFLITIFFCFSIFSQQSDKSWIKGLGGPSGEIAYSVVTDNNGNVFITGAFNGIVDFDPGINIFNVTSTSQDFFVLKLNQFGNFQWVKTFESTGSETGWDVTLDLSGNIIVAGQFKGTVDFDPGMNVFNLISNTPNNVDVFILKLDSNGNFIWAKKYGNTGDDAALSVLVDLNNNIICTGYFTGSVFGLTSNGSADGFVLKLNSSGSQIWAKKFGGPTTGVVGNDIVKSVQIDINSNIYVVGNFEGLTDFNPNAGVFNITSIGGQDAFIVKLDDFGDFIWANSVGSVNTDYFQDIAIDNLGNSYCTGSYNNLSSSDMVFTKFDSNGNIVFNNIFFDSGGHSILSDGNEITLIGNLLGNSTDIDPHPINSYNISGSSFVSKYSNTGSFLSAETFPINEQVSSRGACFDPNMHIISVGFFQGEKIFETNNGLISISSNGSLDMFIYKHPKKKVLGRIYNDFTNNCIEDSGEFGVDGMALTITPGNFVTQTNQSGIWSLDSLPPGNYTVWIDTTNVGEYTFCSTNQTFTITSPNEITQVTPIGIKNNFACSDPNITIHGPFLRRCFSNQIVYVQACNDNAASAFLDSSFVVVTLDPLLTVNSASLPFTALGNNTFQFQTGTLTPGQCVDFTLSTTLSCNALIGQTICMNAELFPVENCALDSIPSGPNWDSIPSEGSLGGLPQPCLGPWDQSSLSVDGWCQNDSIYFTVTNTGVLGGGDMECYAPVWLTVNGVVTFTDSIMLQGGQTITYAFAGNGQTWILNASQHPLHPGNSQPNAFVERCGNAANWTPGEVNDYPQDDADPVIDIFCDEVSGSYDPNDKRGYPNGVTNMNYIQPNQQLQYVIRFQNTGTDTAFTVVIRDTLDLDLNIFTVTPGVSSHNYEFRMYGPRVLEWTFNNINLPDSTIDQVGSNGFVTFHVEQNPNLSPGTVITNDADIYFDYNDPITTNTTIHRIYEGFPNVLSLQDLVNSKESIVLYPNPTSSEITITSDKFTNEPYTLFDQMGRTVGSGKLSGTNTTISLSTLSKGIYILKVEGDYESAIVVKE